MFWSRSMVQHRHCSQNFSVSHSQNTLGLIRSPIKARKFFVIKDRRILCPRVSTLATMVQYPAKNMIWPYPNNSQAAGNEFQKAWEAQSHHPIQNPPIGNHGSMSVVVCRDRGCCNNTSRVLQTIACSLQLDDGWVWPSGIALSSNGYGNVMKVWKTLAKHYG